MINDDVTYCLVEKTGKAKLWRIICLVMKHYITLILKSRDCPFGGNGSAARDMIKTIFMRERMFHGNEGGFSYIRGIVVREYDRDSA